MNKRELKVFLNNEVINFLYRAFRSTKIFFRKGVTATKAAICYCVWIIKDRKLLYRHLQEDYGITNIFPVNVLFWKHSVKYLEGKKDGVPVFIKTGGYVDTTEREIRAINYIIRSNSFLKKHVPELITNNPEADDLIIEKKIEGKSLASFLSMPEEVKGIIVNQIFSIYIAMRDSGVRHLDLRPANFIVVEAGDQFNVFLIDFGYSLANSNDVFAYIGKSSAIIEILHDLGGDFAYKNDSWDDAYSCLQTLKYFYPSLLRDFKDIWQILNEDIGKHTVIIGKKVW